MTTDPHPQDLAEEAFGFDYLPAEVAAVFRDAVGCYQHDLSIAFASMCRLTAQAVFRDLGEHARLRLFDQVDEIRELADLDEATFQIVRHVLFDRGAGESMPPSLDRVQAAILLETVKDLLYQAYIRGEKLRRVLKMRRLFARAENTG
jgi:hypothetical protein